MTVAYNYIGSMLVQMCIAFAIYLPARAVYMRKKKIRAKLWHELFLAAFIIWSVGIISQTVLPAANVGMTTDGLYLDLYFPNGSGLSLEGSQLHFYKVYAEFESSVNLVPFKTLREFFNPQHSELDSGSWRIIRVVNLLANFLLFLPWGFLLPSARPKARHVRRAMLTALFFVLLIEIIQFFTGRSADVDDVLLNMAGIVSGFALFKLINNCVLNNAKTQS